MSTTIDTPALHGLRDGFGGRLLEPHDEDYDQARTLFNAMIDRRPSVIAQCAGVDDVAAAVRFARESALPCAIRSGGHSVAGASMCEGGIVIDVRPMKGIEIDAERRVARVGAGCTWGEFDRAAQEHGLATTGGRVSTTGVAGLTLGGGSGWLERKHGLACDNLLAVELVTAGGQLVRGTEDEHPDLFWALHGGGGNFGVATTFEFRLHPVGPEVFVLLVVHRADRERELLEVFRDFAATAPEGAGTAFVHFTGAAGDEMIPPELVGEPLVMVAGMHAGPVDEGAAALRPLREFGLPAIDGSGPMPYADFQCALDDPPGFRNYWTAEYLADISDEALDMIAAHSARTPSGPSQTFIVPWGAAVARVGDHETPMAKRDTTWVVHPFGVWDDPNDDEANKAWGRGFRDALAPYATAGVYLNFIGDEGEPRIRAAFGEDKYLRLSAIKSKYDPDNLFRLNHNTDLGQQLGAKTLGGRLWRLHAGQASTRHRPRTTTELSVVLEGPGRMRVGDDLHTLEPLSSVLVEPGTVRQLFNDSEEDQLWLVAGAPPEPANTLAMTPEDSPGSIRTGRGRCRPRSAMDRCAQRSSWR